MNFKKKLEELFGKEKAVKIYRKFYKSSYTGAKSISSISKIVRDEITWCHIELFDGFEIIEIRVED